MSKHSQKMAKAREDRSDGYVSAGHRAVRDSQGRLLGTMNLRDSKVGSKLLLNLAYRQWEIVTKGAGVVLDAKGNEVKPDPVEGGKS